MLTKYYYAGAQRVAMNKGGALSFLLSDHLGSTTVTLNADGSAAAELRYSAWGETRDSSGTTPTSRQFTGQINETAIGLYFYNARFYDSSLGRFVQADSIVPNPYNPMDWDHYSYVRNNAINFNDPTGHALKDPNEGCGLDECVTSFQNELASFTSNKSTDPNKPPFLFPLTPSQSNQGQCNSSFQKCLSPWEQPKWWDTNPAHPDYYTLAINLGKLFGITGTFIFDRYGNVYVGVGPNIGKSLTPLSGSINGGWIGSSNDDDIPDQGNIQQFLTGISFNGQVGALGDIAITISPGAGDYLSHYAFEHGGVIIAVVGVSGSISVKSFDGYTIFGGQK